MNWFTKLERKFSKYAIRNLMTYIIILYALGFILNMFYSGVYDAFFSLKFSEIFSGQVWRLVTFIIQPPSNNPIFAVFVLYFYYLIGTVLENIWGAFRFNLYFFSGMFFNIIAALVVYLVFGLDFPLSTQYLNLALFMAFALEQPDMQVLLFFVLPIKIKWMAYVDAFIFGLTIISGYLVPYLALHGVDFASEVWYSLSQVGILAYPDIPKELANPILINVFLEPFATICYSMATAALVAMINFIIFFLLYKKGGTKTAAQKNYEKAIRTARQAQENNAKRKESFNERIYNANSEKTTWESANRPYSPIKPGFSKHRCAACGKTELDDDNLMFRFCSKCEGEYEYCSEHLYTHIHVKKEN